MAEAHDTQERVAILTRLREMLSRQRGRFQAYLDLLERQEQSINRGDAEALLAQVEMEQTIIAEIFALKKVITPLEALYQAAYPAAESTVPKLRTVLESMGSEIADHNARNRQLLKDRMDDLRSEIRSLRTWPRAAFETTTPRLVDIST